MWKDRREKASNHSAKLCTSQGSSVKIVNTFDATAVFRNVITALARGLDSTINSLETHVFLVVLNRLTKFGEFLFWFTGVVKKKKASEFMTYDSDCMRTKCLQKLFLSFGGSVICVKGISVEGNLFSWQPVVFFFQQIKQKLHQIDSK